MRHRTRRSASLSLAAAFLAWLPPPAVAQENATPFTDVAVTPGAVCTLDAAGVVRCTGSAFRTGLAPPADLAPATDIDLGSEHGCAVLADGAVRCWGGDRFGQLDVPAGLVARSVSSGGAHSCAVRGDGGLACWGLATNGRLEPPTPDARHVDVSVADEHACAVRDDGTVACWGADAGGSTAVPDDLEPAVAVASARRENCAVGVSGRIRCFGQLELSAPTGTGYVDVAIGNFLVCGLDASGRADCVANEAIGAADGIVDAARAAGTAGPFAALDLGGRFGSLIGCGVRTDGALACFAGTEDLPLPGAGAGPDFVPELAASVYSDTTAELSWARPESFRVDLAIAGFELTRDGEPFASLGRVYSFLDESLVAGEPVRYAVRALDANGRAGPPSNEIVVDTGARAGGVGGGGAGDYAPPARPAEPRGLEALVYGPSAVELVWERAPVPVFGHEVRRDGELVAFTRGTSAFLEGPSTRGPSRFEVLAVDRDGTILGVASVAIGAGVDGECR